MGPPGIKTPVISKRFAPRLPLLSALGVNEVREDALSFHWERCREPRGAAGGIITQVRPRRGRSSDGSLADAAAWRATADFGKKRFFRGGGSRGYFTGTPLRILGTRLQFCALWHDRLPECSDDTTWDFGLTLFPIRDQGATKARGAHAPADGDEERNQTPTSVSFPPQTSRKICIKCRPRTHSQRAAASSSATPRLQRARRCFTFS